MATKKIKFRNLPEIVDDIRHTGFKNMKYIGGKFLVLYNNREDTKFIIASMRNLCKFYVYVTIDLEKEMRFSINSRRNTFKKVVNWGRLDSVMSYCYENFNLDMYISVPYRQVSVEHIGARRAHNSPIVFMHKTDHYKTNDGYYDEGCLTANSSANKWSSVGEFLDSLDSNWLKVTSNDYSVDLIDTNEYTSCIAMWGYIKRKRIYTPKGFEWVNNRKTQLTECLEVCAYEEYLKPLICNKYVRFYVEKCIELNYTTFKIINSPALTAAFIDAGCCVIKEYNHQGDNYVILKAPAVMI